VLSDYCESCACRALDKSTSLPACSGKVVQCVADPCRAKHAVCRANLCTVVDG